MGQFSWECKGCDREIRPSEWVRIDDHVGTYNGYGVVVMEDGREWDVFDRDNPNESFTRLPSAWHEVCFNIHPRGEHDRTPSKDAENQGFGRPRTRYLPTPDKQTSKWKEEFGFWTEEDRHEDSY